MVLIFVLDNLYRVDIDAVSYVVVEMSLLSTIFRRVDGVMVQAPHSLLNTKFINNIRRSGATTETFTWDVAFDTTFEKVCLPFPTFDLFSNQRLTFCG